MGIRGYTKNYKLIKPEYNTDTWHDYEYDNLDTIDAVLSAIYASGDWQGFWQNDTNYKAGSVVIDKDTDTMYKVVSDHTTDGNVTFAEYMFNHPEYYQLWSPNNLAKDWAIKDDGLADNQDYSAKAYAVGGVGTETNNAKYYSEQAGIQAEASAEQAAASASSATASYNSEQLALSHANQAASSAASSLTGAEQSVASAAISQEKAEYAANSVAGLESFVQEKQNEINTSLAEAIKASEDAKKYAIEASSVSVGNIFYTSRLDNELNGAVEANGATYSVEAFTGEKSVPELLRKGSLPYVSMAEYESIVSANGSCRAWGWDGGDTFRVPTLKDVYLMAGQAESAGEFISESLPNIKGTFGGAYFTQAGSTTNDTGAFRNTLTVSASRGGGNEPTSSTHSFDASLVSEAYQDGAKVCPDSVRYRAMVQLSTGVQEDATQLKEYKFNNPHFFGQSMWSDVDPKNSSWLVSNGAYHSGRTYGDYYKWLTDIKSGNKTVDGVSVKSVDDEYTDYDWVVNTTDETFRLPLKTKLASGSAVVGNGMSLGLTNGTDNFGLITGAAVSNQTYYLGQSADAYGGEVGGKGATKSLSLDTWSGVTTDSEKSGIETSSNGLKLYFYVGDTLQDPALINAGGVLSDVAEIKGRRHVVETYKNGTSWYRVWSDGWCEQGGYSAGGAYIVTFLKQYLDTNYTALATFEGSYSANALAIVTRTNTGFHLNRGTGATDIGGKFWRAEGYIQ